ncbi:tRNA 4-thiouridine(8) synthase ThiI [Thermocladium modestius]|uniref:Probable tRNA sulfurtransferase n=1 Tax=Thermocladium modestius TaxID=62609 RepID=A0A830GW58_9CREN|nr:tRNA sulfurtransferase [Thermocladium modestius]GGP21514.1 tRNA 4-thiouridine(8) synthase ThiI [Thermocladium modestius]
MESVTLVRYSEIAIKATASRKKMEQLLIHNVADALRRRGIDFADIVKTQGRILIRTNRPSDAAVAASHVFGVVSASPGVEIGVSGLDDIVEKAVDMWGNAVKGRKFAVRVRRIGKHGFTSMDVARTVGSALLGGSGGVDLENPDLELFIEVRYDKAYLYHEVMQGPGGLPLGSQEGKVLGLVSGGIDSPAAAWMMMKRGVYVDMMFCSLIGVDVGRFMKVVKALYDNWIYGYDPLIYVVDCRGLASAIQRNVNPHVWNTVFKYVLYRMGMRIAKDGGYLGMATGESMGQVSSQTLHNLYASSLGIDMPIYRPLVGFDKSEITMLARRAGTYEESIKSIEACVILSRKPRTKAPPQLIASEASKVDAAAQEALGRIVKMHASEIDIGKLREGLAMFG